MLVTITSSGRATAVESATLTTKAVGTATTIENNHSRHSGEGVPARLIKAIPRLPVWTGPV
ncbi:hypothetical protein [Nocardia sp. NPDC004711]